MKNNKSLFLLTISILMAVIVSIWTLLYALDYTNVDQMSTPFFYTVLGYIISNILIEVLWKE